MTYFTRFESQVLKMLKMKQHYIKSIYTKQTAQVTSITHCTTALCLEHLTIGSKTPSQCLAAKSNKVTINVSDVKTPAANPANRLQNPEFYARYLVQEKRLRRLKVTRENKESSC